MNNNQGNKFFTSMPPVTHDNNQNNRCYKYFKHISYSL